MYTIIKNKHIPKKKSKKDGHNSPKRMPRLAGNEHSTLRRYMGF
jgi:hypothetical protein